MTTREQSLIRRRAWSQSGLAMLARSIAAGQRTPPARRLTPREFAEKSFADLQRKSRDLQAERRGKRRRVSEVQNAVAGRNRKAVTLPGLSFMGDKP